MLVTPSTMSIDRTLKLAPFVSLETRSGPNRCFLKKNVTVFYPMRVTVLRGPVSRRAAFLSPLCL